MLISKNWDILIIGGASASGKTVASRALARLYKIDLVRVDDFQVLLEATTTPKALPAIHYWNTHPNWRDDGIDAAVSRLIDAGQALIPGLAAVVADHLVENIPMILEGDFILPEFAATFRNPKIKSIFIHEPSKEQISQNYLAREGEGVQQFRAEVSHAYGNWLADSCEKLGIPVVTSRPWDNLIERIINSCI